MCGYIGKISINKIDQETVETSNSHLTCRVLDETVGKNGNFNEFNGDVDLNYSLYSTDFR